jgi:putative hemolysin
VRSAWLYQTFAGFLLQEFATIPDVSDEISVAGWRRIDGRRIDNVLATRLEG